MEQFLAAQGVTRAEIASVLGLDPSTVSRKSAGSRYWKHTEIVELLAYLTTRLGRQVTFEELFTSSPEPDAIDIPAATVAPTPEV